MQVRTFGDRRIALHFGDQKINRPADRSERAPRGAGIRRPLLPGHDADEILAHLDACGVAVVEGAGRTGATGPIMSNYVYDPDENLIEIAQALLPEGTPDGGGDVRGSGR